MQTSGAKQFINHVANGACAGICGGLLLLILDVQINLLLLAQTSAQTSSFAGYIAVCSMLGASVAIGLSVIMYPRDPDMGG